MLARVVRHQARHLTAIDQVFQGVGQLGWAAHARPLRTKNHPVTTLTERSFQPVNDLHTTSHKWMSLDTDFMKILNKINDLVMQYLPVQLQLLRPEIRRCQGGAHQPAPLSNPNTTLIGWLPWCDW